MRVDYDAVPGFFSRGAIGDLRLLESAPSRVRWECESAGELLGTQLTFEMQPEVNGATRVRFVHSGWRDVTDYLAACNTVWSMLLPRLKDAAERVAPRLLVTHAGPASGKTQLVTPETGRWRQGRHRVLGAFGVSASVAAVLDDVLAAGRTGPQAHDRRAPPIDGTKLSPQLRPASP
jgi:hypothetical protein